MNRKERRNLQRQGVQVPKDPTLNIKLSALDTTPAPGLWGQAAP